MVRNEFSGITIGLREPQNFSLSVNGQTALIRGTLRKSLMFSTPIPDNDAERVATLHSYGILDTPPEQGYEDVTAFATYICEVPYSTITFVDKERQWFKSEAGFGTNETERSNGFCACTILHPETLIVEDTLLDPRFLENPFVVGAPKIRFYAGAPILAPNGHVLGTVCVFDDKPRQLSSIQITALESLARQVQGMLEQRKAISRLKTALATSKDAEGRLGELAAIVDSSDDAILSKDLNGIITSWNPAASNMFGYSAEEIIGSSVLKLIPENLRSEETTILESIRAGRRIEHFETQRLTKNGELLDVSLTISPIRNSRGEVIGASKILRDISARKRMEESQQTISKRLAEAAAIVDSSDDAILSKDLNGIITSWNPGAAKVFGYSAEEMIGASILKLIPEELHTDEAVIIGKIRAGERVEHFETVRLTKGGRRLNVSLSISPVKDEHGKVIGAAKILRDISGRKRIEESLLQSEKIAAAGRMASTIAHEVNNPLEAVTNLLYLLRPFITDAAGAEFLATAESEIARVSHIAKQTLGFYREHAAASSISVSQLVQRGMMIYEPRCSAHGITIKKSFSSRKEVVLRQGEMMQVVSNLIANSMYAMPSGGTLSISVEDADAAKESVVVTIKDTGVGVAAENIPKVFDAFFTTRSTIGTGIGLFVAKQFVEGHGGRIELESNQDVKEHGTTVRIYLPFRTLYDESLGK
jgi:PAS domain S-box-containing protein